LKNNPKFGFIFLSSTESASIMKSSVDEWLVYRKKSKKKKIHVCPRALAGHPEEPKKESTRSLKMPLPACPLDV
jgi:hypothetical protein